MIYLIGGAARVSKSTLCQKFSERHGFGWISTDILYDTLRVKGEDGMMNEWNAAPEAIADWFYPYLQRFIWGIVTVQPKELIRTQTNGNAQ